MSVFTGKPEDRSGKRALARLLALRREPVEQDLPAGETARTAPLPTRQAFHLAPGVLQARS